MPLYISGKSELTICLRKICYGVIDKTEDPLNLQKQEWNKQMRYIINNNYKNNKNPE